VRTVRQPLIPRKIWLLGTNQARIAAATAVLEQAGHQVRTAETGSELAPALREFRPDLIVIDIQEQPDRGKHVATQLRADRATRQLPIVLVGGSGPEAAAVEKHVTGPTRRYKLPLDAPSVLNAILCEL
jgi:CheY-like chemotaxis protein